LGSQNFSFEPSSGGPKFCGIACGSYHRTLFYGHREGVFLTVDYKVGGYAQRKVIVGNGVFDELVVTFLNLLIAVVVGRKNLFGFWAILKMHLGDPIYFFCFGQFGKTLDFL
jgi:hypothetical protein